MELINKTGQVQQLNLINKAFKVKAGESVKFSEKDIYDHELTRSMRFFKIKEKIEPVKVEKKFSKGAE